MNIVRKAFIAIVLLAASLSALAFDLPVHHQYVLFNSEARNTDYYNYDMHVVWHKEPDASQMGYYAQFAFYFQTGSVGYMGLQKDNQSGKKAIFSIWDSQGLAQPASSTCKRFNHEGNGTSCIIPFDWKAGHEYKLRVWRIQDSYDGASEKWGGWIIDYMSGEETFIGVVQVFNSKGERGFGSLNGQAITTIENYFGGGITSLGCSNMPNFAVTWNGPFVNNASKRFDTAVVKYDTGVGNPCQNNNSAMSNGFTAVTSQTGNDVRPQTNNATDLWAKYSRQQLDEVDCIFAWAERNWYDVFDQTKFKHRRINRSLYGQHYRDYAINGSGHSVIISYPTGQLLKGDPAGGFTNLGSLEYWLHQSNCRK